MTRRLLVATSTYPRWPGDSHPGFVHDLCAALVRRHDARVRVLAPTSHGAAREEVVDGVEVRRFAYWRDRPDLLRDGPALPTLKAHPTTALQVPTYLAALGAAVRRELRREPGWDAVHAHWIAPQATLAALAGAGLPRGGPRLVGTSHGTDVLGLGPAGRPLLRWTLRRLDAFTGVSRAVVDRARELGLPDEVPAVVAPMGLDADRFRPDADAGAALRDELGIGTAPLAVCVARLVPGKGVDVLLDALPHLRRDHPELRLAVVGDGIARDDLAARADRLGVADAVVFAGHRPHEELPAWYAAADVVVSASRSEGFGLVVAEALVSGTPVVATDLPATRDLLVDPVLGERVPVGDPPALAAAIGGVLEDGSGRRAAVRDRRPGLVARWGWDAVADRYAEVLFAPAPGDAARAVA